MAGLALTRAIHETAMKLTLPPLFVPTSATGIGYIDAFLPSLTFLFIWNDLFIKSFCVKRSGL